MFGRLLGIALVCYVCRLGDAQAVAQCLKRPIEDAFQQCLLHRPATRTQCVNDFKAALQAAAGCGGQAPDSTVIAVLAASAAQTELAACKMAWPKTGCNITYVYITNKSLPENPIERENKDKFEAARGVASALGDKMNACGSQACKDQAKIEMGYLRGRIYSHQEFAYDLRNAGAKKGGDYINECVQNATDVTERKQCLTSDGARAAIAQASGRNVRDIPDSELIAASRQKATQSIRNIMDACTSVASNSGDLQKAEFEVKSDIAKCLQRADLKSAIASSVGEESQSIPDSKVHEYTTEAARSDVLTSAVTCDKSDPARCIAEMKTVWATATGKKPADISAAALERDVQKALSRSIGDCMVACVEMAGVFNRSALAKCASSVATLEIRRADYQSSSRIPSKSDIQKTLRDAGKNRARDVMGDCNQTRGACFGLMKQRVAASMGKLAGSISHMEAETLNRAGAFMAAAETAAACAHARKVNAAATCDDPYQMFLDARKMLEPSDPNAMRNERNSVMQGAATDVLKSIHKICLEKSTIAGVNACVHSFKVSNDETMSQLYKGVSFAVRDKRMKTAAREASREIIGYDYTACLNSIETTLAADVSKVEKDKCLMKLNSKKAVAGMGNVNASVLLLLYRGQEVGKASLACDIAARQACRADAMNVAMSTGMKKREWVAVKSIGEREAAAKAWADCKLNATQTDSACNDVAKATFVAVSGSATAAAWDAVKASVALLGRAKQNGVALKIVNKQQMDVDIQTSAVACSSTLKATFINKVVALLAANKMFNLTLTEVMARGAGCRVADGKAEISVSVGSGPLSNAQIATASDQLATLLNGVDINVITRRLSSHDNHLLDLEGVGVANSDEHRSLSSREQAAERGLGVKRYWVENAYATQGTLLCASDDSSCGVVILSTTTTTTSQTKQIGTTSNTWKHGISIGSMVTMVGAVLAFGF